MRPSCAWPPRPSALAKRWCRAKTDGHAVPTWTSIGSCRWPGGRRRRGVARVGLHLRTPGAARRVRGARPRVHRATGIGDATARRQGGRQAPRRVRRGPGEPVVARPRRRAHGGRTGPQIGYPLLLKAAAGGGGRGIRRVGDPTELQEALRAASAEAAAAFGDASVFVEAFVPEARHVEVQILADVHGGVWALGTRDCSMQRRQQKVLEEAPAPDIAPDVEHAICDAAVRMARASGYVGAGTAEFLLLPDGRTFYFLEMNTRLQVEHTVTEEVYGIDLVGAQIDIARGTPLPPEGPPSPRGVAVEARINAEDPDQALRSEGRSPRALHRAAGSGHSSRLGLRSRRRGAHGVRLDDRQGHRARRDQAPGPRPPPDGPARHRDRARIRPDQPLAAPRTGERHGIPRRAR